MEDQTINIMEEQDAIPYADMQENDDTTPLPGEDYTRKGYLKVKCSCGHVEKVSEDLIENGLTWTMLFDEDHFMLLTCPKCKVSLKMYLEEEHFDEVPEESN